MRKLCLLGVVGAAAISVSAQHQSAKDLERKAKNQLGQVAVLCGTVVFFRCERATLTTMLVLLDDVSGKVAVAILPGLRKSLGTRVDDHYISQNVQLELLKGTKASTQLRPLTSRRWKCVVALGRCRTRLRLVRDLLAKTALSCPS